MKFEDFFKIMHEQIRQKFPRLCDCGIIYTDEADYNSRTIEVKGHADYREIGLGRQFVRNCPPPCNTTLGNSVIFDAQTEDKFFDYIGNRKKREHRMASEVVETFRQEYNQWLASLPQVQRNIILGVGCQTIDDIFTQMPQEKIAYLQAKKLNRSTPNEIEKARIILSRNPGRIEMIALQPGAEKLEEHKRFTEEVRKQDAKLGRHTTILAIGGYENLRAGYRELDINGVIPNDTDTKTVRKIVQAYLPL